MDIIERLEKKEYQSEINELLEITQGLKKDLEEAQLLMIALQEKTGPGIRKIMEEFSEWQGDNFDKWNGKKAELKKIRVLTQNLKEILFRKTGVNPKAIEKLHKKKNSQQE